MNADLRLKTKQAFWETPRNLVLIIGAIAAVVAAVAGAAGYKAGQQTTFPPGTVITIPPASPAK